MNKLAFLLLSAAALTGCASGDGRVAASAETPATATNTRVYSRDRLERTGESSAAESLSRVDPAITISRGGR